MLIGYARVSTAYQYLNMQALAHLIQTIKELNEKGIGFKSLQENIDTTTSGGISIRNKNRTEVLYD